MRQKFTKKATIVTFLCMVFLLGACASETEAMRQAQSVGSPFTRALAEEYRLFVMKKPGRFFNAQNREISDVVSVPSARSGFRNFLFDTMEAIRAFEFSLENDPLKSEAVYFANKGLAAASGETVLPESLDKWPLKPWERHQFSIARAKLITLFDHGARELSPALAGKAQAMFDCWIAKLDLTWPFDCRLSFEKVVEALSQGSARGLRSEEILTGKAIDPFKPMEPENAVFLLFFDWNSFEINKSGDLVIRSIYEQIIKARPHQIFVTGHADTSGPQKYNYNIALERAESVKTQLVALGIPATRIVTRSKGEKELMVQTTDNIREPANRRVKISFVE